MMLLKRYLRLELNTLLRNNIRFRVIGRASELAPDIRRELTAAEEKTAANTGMLFNIALNYGGRAEIVEAARRLLEGGVKPEELDEERFAGFLYTAGQPDPDLLIRTSGEMRVSNFLLWQIAYAEIWVTETLWPDFRKLPPARGDPRLPETPPPLRRHHASGDRRPMTPAIGRGHGDPRPQRRASCCRSCSARSGTCRRSARWCSPDWRRRWRSSNTRRLRRRSAPSVPRVLAGAGGAGRLRVGRASAHGRARGRPADGA